MRTTAILNLKGGVGKTATTVNLAAELASSRHKKKVLVIDADSQCNLTGFFKHDKQKTNTLADLLRKETDHAIKTVVPTDYPRIDILPADDSLMDLDLSKAEAGAVDIKCLAGASWLLSPLYDYVLIDCPPAFNAATAAALLAADDVVIPMKLDAFSINGMSNLMRQINTMKELNPKLKVAGVLPTMFYNSPQIVEAEKMLKEVLPTYHHIRRSPTVDNMTFKQEPLLKCSPASGALADYKIVACEYLEREVL